MIVAALCVLFVAGILLTPDPAQGWGPISHLAHGSEVLKNVIILGVDLQQLLSRYPLHYLYGCVGADITLGKKYTWAMQAHCHSWQVGWQVLSAARTDAERAFGYGYLSHLAADVYSHNHFVPTQLVVSFRARTLRHVYWEARFDAMQDREYRAVVRELRQHEFPDCDELLKRVVRRTIFSFRTNKRIFDSVLAFHEWDNWHQMMQRVSTRSRYVLSPAVIPRYNGVCIGSILDLLRKGKRASCQAADPTGFETLTLAKRVRRTLKNLEKLRSVTPALERKLELLNDRRDLECAFPADVAAGIARALG
jgi:hypothetical protein